MKSYITIITLVLGLHLGAKAQQEVKLSFKFLPQRHYMSKINMNASGTVNVQGNAAIVDSLKAKGISQNMNMALKASGDIDINTAAESNGQVPLTMRIDNVTAQPSFNGQMIPFPPAAMLNGKMIYAKSSGNGKLHIDSVSGKHLPDSVLNHINNMMDMFMSKSQLLEHTFKLGDTFTQNVPFNMPMKGMPPINATTKISYHLLRIADGKAYFGITQTTNYTGDKNNMHAVVTGNGTGSMTYDIKEHYPSEFQSEMKINVHAASSSKGGADAMFTITTNSTTSFSK